MAIRQCSDTLIRLRNGAEINVAEWPGTQGPFVCVHGLTSSSRCFAGLANELPDHRMVSIDLRGRGASSKKSPFGIEQHAEDVAEVMECLGLENVTFIGHSMGTYVAGALIAKHPRLVEEAVFVDGGYWAPDASGLSAQEVFKLKFSVFMTKLQRSWKDAEEYFGFYSSGALYPKGVDAYGKAHFEYDLEGQPPALKARVSSESIEADWLSVNEPEQVLARLRNVRCPVLLLLAPGGLTGTGDEVVEPRELAEIEAAVSRLEVVEVPDSNHHTILTSKHGAEFCARQILDFVRAQTSERA